MKKISRQSLLSALESIVDTEIAVVGDIMLDRYIFGSVDRISPEAPVPVVHVKKVEDRLGGAGNVVRNLCNLGAKVSLFGIVGHDPEGERVKVILDKHKVDTTGLLVDGDRPTTLKTRVIAQRQQVVRIDREEVKKEQTASSTKLNERLANLVRDSISRARAVIVSDYGKGAISDVLLTRLEEARQSGKIGIGKVPLVVDPHPTHYSIYKGMSVGKPNRREAEIASGIAIDGRESATSAAHVLLKRWNAEMMLVSLGESGLVIAQASGAPDIFLETVAQEVSDVSGAGDTVTAVFAAALAAGNEPSVAGELANLAAGVVVSEVGTVPVDIAKLKLEIERL